MTPLQNPVIPGYCRAQPLPTAGPKVAVAPHNVAAVCDRRIHLPSSEVAVDLRATVQPVAAVYDRRTRAQRAFPSSKQKSVIPGLLPTAGPKDQPPENHHNLPAKQPIKKARHPSPAAAASRALSEVEGGSEAKPFPRQWNCRWQNVILSAVKRSRRTKDLPRPTKPSLEQSETFPSSPSYPSCLKSASPPNPVNLVNPVKNSPRKFRYSVNSVKKFLASALALFLLPALLPAAPPDPDLDAANQAYTSGSYDAAAKLFRQIIATRGYSAPLCFNLANAEARAGHPGQAMLNYERARYLAPNDTDINHNLQHARQLAGLEPNSYRWWQILLRSIDWTVWLCIMAACLLLLLLAIVGTSFLPTLAPTLRLPPRQLQNIFRAVIFAGVPICLLLGFVELSTIGFNNRIEAVIVAPKEATLLISPFDTADKIGTIPEGELVTVEDRHNDYLRIEARDQHFGWIRLKDLEPVVAGSFDTPPPN